MQGPYAEHIVDLPAVLREVEHPDEDRTGHDSRGERAERVHHIGSRADRNEARKRPVVDEARVVAPDHEAGDRAARHGHERIHRDQARDLVDGLRAHHVESEPAHRQHPCAEREEGNAGGRERDDAPVFRIAPQARSKEQHRRERDPSAERVHDHRAREVMELLAERQLEPTLHAPSLVPRDALEERIEEAHQEEGGRDLRIELESLRDAARHDRRDRRREREEKEELHQLVAALQRERLGAGEEIHAVRDRVADKEVRDRRHREIHQDLHQRVHLVLAPNGAELEEREAGVHRQHEDGAQQDEQDVGRRLECFHGPLRSVCYWMKRPRLSAQKDLAISICSSSRSA